MQSVTYRQPGLRVTEHTLEVPLDHARPDGERIEVFAHAVVLAVNDVLCAAAIYVNDMYVPRAFSEQTARRIRGPRPWITTSSSTTACTLAKCSGG